MSRGKKCMNMRYATFKIFNIPFRKRTDLRTYCPRKKIPATKSKAPLGLLFSIYLTHTETAAKYSSTYLNPRRQGSENFDSFFLKKKEEIPEIASLLCEPRDGNGRVGTDVLAVEEE